MLDSTLAKVSPPERPLPSLRLLRTVVRNPIEAWPRPVYEEPLFRSRLFGRESLFVSDPDLIRTVLVDRAESFCKAETMRRALRPALGDAILTADGAHWRWQRRAVAGIFRPERVAALVPAMLAATERTRDRLLAAGPDATIDLASQMTRTTFDIIVETMLSGTRGIDAARVEAGVTDYLESTSWNVAYALLKAPGWLPYPGQRRAERARDYLRAELLRLARERRAAGGGGHDLAALLIGARDPETGQAMSDRDVADNLLTFITAGHETTALALAWTFYALSRHPDVERRLVEEIETVTGGAPLAPEHLEHLPYARQVVQEAMRLYPPAPVVVRSALETLSLGPETVTAGTPVYVPVYAVHRHARLWERPDAFDPGRFAPEAARARHRFAYLPFGAGPRICIGMGFAMREAVAILAVLVRALQVAVPDGHEPRLKLRITLRPEGGLPARVTPRGRDPESPAGVASR
ncbi:cytochrome P450 [Salinarimonas soli]|uniref:Cytochrome P450 n=1 Tax=Salinarimonas soli TaxID=1638099 RepID=A0A5B2V7E4_9HYPH|nr:cytochrome P450 [Salinarimonas soli]KAA2234924.1 cytochrome P450 [Salinarimonas soli]